MSAGLRIAVLCTAYPRFDGDVAGCFVEGFVGALRAAGHDVTAFAPAPLEPAADRARWVRYAPAPLARTFYGAGVPDNIRDPRTWPGLISYPLALRAAARGRWDAVVAHFGVPCGLVAMHLETPRVLTVWHSADVALASRLPRRWTRALLETGTHWLVREEHRRRLEPRRTFVSPMGVHPPRAMARVSARELLGLDERPVVLFIGRLVEIKGVDLLARALRGRDDVQLVVAGEGPELARLRALAPDARFLGEVRGARKDAAFAAADVVAMPSRRLASGRSEGAPMVATEAALAHRPRVATRSVGLDEDEAWVVDESAEAVARGIDAALQGAHDVRVRRAEERAHALTWDALTEVVDAGVRDAWR